MWADFVLNSTPKEEWFDWAEELSPVSEEKGDRAEVSEELEIDLRKLEMLNRILSLSTPSQSPACAQNHISLKTFVDWFSLSMGVTEAHKRKGEIEAAVISVYGQRYSTSNYWLLTNLQDTARRLKDGINDCSTDIDTEDKLPFLL